MPLIKEGDVVVETIAQEDVVKQWTLAEAQAKCAECSAKIAGLQAEHQKFLDIIALYQAP